MTGKTLSRRDFLRVSALTAAGAALAGCATPTPERVVVTQEVPVVATKEVLATVVAQPEKTTVRWFIGLGTGTNPEQVPVEDEWVELFNKGQNEIELVHEIVPNDVAYDTLKTEMASGDPPDIVGPTGRRGANEFRGSWLDLMPYLEGTYDLTLLEEGAIAGWTDPEQGLIGMPFGVFPSALYINRDLFDEAGLPYPPLNYGDQYDGEEWTVEKMSEVAKVLTVDANGNDATSPNFDPENIVQYGYHHQWTDARGWGTFFGAGNFVAEDGKTAQCPDHWREAFTWYYDAMWNSRFAPNGPAQNSDLLAAGNCFNSGKVAMAHCHLWYTCCVGDVPNWDYGIVPSYKGTVTCKLHADVISALKTTQAPEAAARVIYEIVTSPKLLSVWGAFPSFKTMQAGFFADKNAQFTQGVHWDTIMAGLNYVDVPNHEDYMPNFSQADDRVKAFGSALNDTADLDVDAEIDKLVSDLQAIFEAA